MTRNFLANDPTAMIERAAASIDPTADYTVSGAQLLEMLATTATAFDTAKHLHDARIKEVLHTAAI